MSAHIARKVARNACCRSAEVCLYECTSRFIKTLPVPSDYEPIASIFYYSGIHKHREFQLLVDISDIEGDFLKKRVCIELETGISTSTATSIPISETGSVSNIGSRVSIKIRQCDSTLSLNVYRKHILTRTILSQLSFNVERDILDLDFPKQKWYILSNNYGVVGRIKISFYKIDIIQNIADCLVLQQALLCANEYIASGIDIRLNIFHHDIMLEAEKLMLFSYAIEGPIITKNNNVSQMRYVKAVYHEGAWYWKHWNSKNECRENRNPEVSIPILSISTVIKHPTDYSLFYLKHYTKEGPHDLIFKTVDRSRDLWSDALFLFIESVRRYLEHFDDFEALQQFKI